MRSVVGGLVLAALLVFGAVPASAARTQADEVGLALSAAVANVVYVPAKLATAAVGLVGGAVTGFLTAGDTRAAYALWVPAAGGTFLLTPEHLDGTKPIEFFGSDYADRPSTVPNHGGNRSMTVYEAMYGQ